MCCSCYRMPQNAFFLRTRELLVSQKMTQRHFFPTLHPLSMVIFATATVLAFVLLRDSRFNCHCYTQHPRQHVYIGPIQDPCGLEYRPHMGYPCGIHIGNENGFSMGPIWDLSGIHYGTHVFLRYITHVSHVGPIYFPCGSQILPIWIPHEYQMFPRWFSCKSWFNPRLLGCILLMFSVFL